MMTEKRIQVEKLYIHRCIGPGFNYINSSAKEKSIILIKMSTMRRHGWKLIFNFAEDD